MSGAGETKEEVELRGKGRGSRFFVLGREVWERIWKVKSENRLNLALTFLVLLAGTGSDQRLSKWSTKACEEHVGIGKPRARRAIDELIAGGLLEQTAESSRLRPQYLLPDVSQDDDPIFLPVQIVTGFAQEHSILRRVRETGDALTLRMLIDLYGLVQLDATYGVPIESLRSDGGKEARKITELGVHVLWALPPSAGTSLHAKGEWTTPHYAQGSANNGWAPLWERIATLQKMRALTFEPWAFDSSELDAEPMFPVDFAVLYSHGPKDEVAELSRTCLQIATAMTEDREYLLERYSNDMPIVLAAHQQMPALRGVAKLAVEPDTPGCRLAYGRRKELVAERLSAYRSLLDDLSNGRFDRPLGSPRGEAA